MDAKTVRLATDVIIKLAVLTLFWPLHMIAGNMAFPTVQQLFVTPLKKFSVYGQEQKYSIH